MAEHPRVDYRCALGNDQILDFFVTDEEVLGYLQGIGVFAFERDATPNCQIGYVNSRQPDATLERIMP